MSVVDDRFAKLSNADTRIEELTAEVAKLKSGGPGGTSGGVTDGWKESVDRRLQQHHEDVRALLKNGIASVVALAAMIAGLYFYSNTKFEAVNDRLTRIELQLQKIDGKLDVLLERQKHPDKPG